MSGQLTAMQLGGLLRQRCHVSPLVGGNAISLDGGLSWWVFYIDGDDLPAIGGPVVHGKSRSSFTREWNPLHAVPSYFVTEVNPDTAEAMLIVRIGYEDSPAFAFKVHNRPVRLVVIDESGQMSDAGSCSEQTLESIEYLGRAHVVMPEWQSLPKRIVRER